MIEVTNNSVLGRAVEVVSSNPARVINIFQLRSSSHAAQVYGLFFEKNVVLVKNVIFFRTGEKLENSKQNQNDKFCL